MIQINLTEQLAKLIGQEGVVPYSERIGVSPSLPYGWLRGSSPSLKDVFRFARAAKVDPYWLACGMIPKERVTPVDEDVLRRALSAQASVPLSELARRCALPRGRLRSFLQKGASPTLDTLLALAQGTGVSFRWLLTGQGPERPFEGSISETVAPPPSLPANHPPLVPSTATSTEQDDEARLADFQALITASLEQRDQRLASWLRTELDLVRDRLEERWPQLIRRHPSAKGGAA